MILPLNLLRKFRLSTRQTIALSAIFGIGFVIIGVAIARLIEVTPATTNYSASVSAIARDPITLSAWSHIEASVAVIVASLPTFRFISRTADRKYHEKSPPQADGLGPSIRTIGSAVQRKVNRSEADTTNVESINEEILGSSNELHNLNQDGTENPRQGQGDYVFSDEIVQPKPTYSPEVEHKAMKDSNDYPKRLLPVDMDTASTDSSKKERGFV